MRIWKILWFGVFIFFIFFNISNGTITKEEENEGNPNHSQTKTETQKPNEKSDSCIKLPKFVNWLRSVFKKSQPVLTEEASLTAEIMEDLQQVVEGTIKLENTKFKDLNLTNLIFSGQAEELFPEMIKRMSLNYEQNLIQNPEELEKLREAQLAEILKMAEEQGKGKGICHAQEEEEVHDNDNGQEPDHGLVDEITEVDEGTSTNKKADKEFENTVKDLMKKGLKWKKAIMLAYLQTFTPIKENPEVDDKRMHFQEYRKGILQKIKKLSTKREAMKLRATLKADVKAQERKEWRQKHSWKNFQENWSKNKLTAPFKWLGYWLNPRRCVGLNNLVLRFSQTKEEKLKRKYKIDGTVLFNLFAYLNGISPESINEKGLKADTMSTDVVRKNKALDEIIETLEGITISALLVPFKHRPTIRKYTEQNDHETDDNIERKNKTPKDGNKEQMASNGKQGLLEDLDLEKGEIGIKEVNELPGKKKSTWGWEKIFKFILRKKEKTIKEWEEPWDWDLDGIGPLQMAALKLVLTDKEVQVEVDSRIKAKHAMETGHSNSNHRPLGDEGSSSSGSTKHNGKSHAQHDGRRRKRAGGVAAVAMPHISFGGIALGAGAIGALAGFLVAFLALDLGAVWCLGWFEGYWL